MFIAAIFVAVVFGTPAFHLIRSEVLPGRIVLIVGLLPTIGFFVLLRLLVADSQDATVLGNSTADLADITAAAVFVFACWCGGALLAASSWSSRHDR